MGNQVLQVNGKAYDAITGRRIDGVLAPKKPKTTPVKISTATKRTAPAKRQPNHTNHRQAQHAQTLMRRAVKQPQAGLKKQLHVQHEVAHQSSHPIAVKHTASHIDKARLNRAQTVEKHTQVRRFHTPTEVAVMFADVPVRAAPQDNPTNEPPVIPSPTPTNTPVDIFEHAIANATHYVDIAAHKTQFRKKARRHTLGMAGGALALFMLTGVAAYLNMPTLQMKIASVRSGVTAPAPDFDKVGFTYGGVTAHDARLVLGLTSETGNYHLTRQTTNWSGEAMISHVSSVRANGTPNYSTINVDGQTVYRLSDNQFTWVRNGIWYSISGNAPLNDTQLAALVKNT